MEDVFLLVGGGLIVAPNMLARENMLIDSEG